MRLTNADKQAVANAAWAEANQSQRQSDQQTSFDARGRAEVMNAF